MRKSGFSIIEVIVVLVIVGIIVTLGIVGYGRWQEAQNNKNKTGSNDSSQQAAANAPEIKQTADLDKATTTLDSADLGESDTTDLDSQSNSF